MIPDGDDPFFEHVFKKFKNFGHFFRKKVEK